PVGEKGIGVFRLPDSEIVRIECTDNQLALTALPAGHVRDKFKTGIEYIVSKNHLQPVSLPGQVELESHNMKGELRIRNPDQVCPRSHLKTGGICNEPGFPGLRLQPGCGFSRQQMTGPA